MNLWPRSPPGVNSTKIKGITEGSEIACEKGF